MGIKINETSENEDCKGERTNVPSSDADKKLSVKNVKDYLSSLSDLSWWVSLALLSCAALITRLSYLNYLPGTTWDEVHFGGFANQYINRTFYNDVHPPLGKIFIAGAAYIAGYKGNFNFSEGNFYDDTIRYQLIRSEMAILGAIIVPISFLTVYELSHSVEASAMAALAVLCDTFIHKINTLILLDPLLNLTICCAVFCSFKFHSYRKREFSLAWWSWLFITGVLLGLVMSIKYIGVFTVLFVGLHTAYQLYLIACDKRNSIWYVLPHTIARALCLILLPIFIYLGGFVLHLFILSESRPNEGGWLHTRFFASFNNTEYDNKTFAKYVNYGSNITIETSSLHVGYLDSWFDIFPSELTAACQVVSTLPLRDPEGTEWMMKRVDLEKGSVYDPSNPLEPPILVRNGDWVVLTHLGTQRSLRSHNRRAPYTKKLYQVCGYGDNGTGGPFETWRLIIPGVAEGEPLQVFGHDFMLKHYKLGCYLSASDVTLSKTWASEGAKEVACSRNPNYPTLLWHINWIDTNKVVNETTIKEHRMGLWERIMQLHKIMFNVNAGMKKKDDKYDFTDSKPWMWPIAFQMQLLAGYADDSDGIVNKFSVAAYNPMIVYLNVASFGALFILVIYHYFKILRSEDELPRVVHRREKVLIGCFWLALCWATHYLPFFFMSRILYIHHYCPAYIYSCMITGIILNYLCEVASERVTKKWTKINLKKDHLMAIPAAAFIVSYVCLYSMATYVEGEIFSSNKLNYYLDKLYLGQPWLQFGYKWDYYEAVTYTSTMIPLEFTENPFLNASLYYTTKLNTTMSKFVEKGEINPVAASNFTLWTTSSISMTSTNTTVNVVSSNEDGKKESKIEDNDKTEIDDKIDIDEDDGRKGVDDNKMSTL